MVRDILELAAVFDRVTFTWTKREGNYVAHRLAVFAFSCISASFLSIFQTTLLPLWRPTSWTSNYSDFSLKKKYIDMILTF